MRRGLWACRPCLCPRHRGPWGWVVLCSGCRAGHHRVLSSISGLHPERTEAAPSQLSRPQVAPDLDTAGGSPPLESHRGRPGSQALRTSFSMETPFGEQDVHPTPRGGSSSCPQLVGSERPRVLPRGGLLAVLRSSCLQPPCACALLRGPGPMGCGSLSSPWPLLSSSPSWGPHRPVWCHRVPVCPLPWNEGPQGGAFPGLLLLFAPPWHAAMSLDNLSLWTSPRGSTASRPRHSPSLCSLVKSPSLLSS